MEEAYHLPITGELDLHTFRPNETKSAVDEYLYECHKQGINIVRIVHGKGKSVQKHMVRAFLSNHPLVVRFMDGSPDRGGWGATIVELLDSGESAKSPNK